jgi:hypothetical protein
MTRRYPYQFIDFNQPLVDPKTGRISPYFQRQLFGQTENAQEVSDEVDTFAAAIAALQADKADKSTLINPGFGLSGGGDLNTDRTLSLGNPALTDPGADRGLFWDDSASQLDWLEFGSGLSLTGKILSASGGGGGGGSPLVPFPHVAIGVSGANTGAPSIQVVPCYATSSDPVTGLIFPTRDQASGRTAAPCIYDGGPVASAVGPTGRSLVASGPGVALVNDVFIPIPFTTPFVPTPGNIYYAGFSIYGTSGTVRILSASDSIRFYFAGGTFNPPPATLPAMTATGGITSGFFSY